MALIRRSAVRGVCPLLQHLTAPRTPPSPKTKTPQAWVLAVAAAAMMTTRNAPRCAEEVDNAEEVDESGSDSGVIVANDRRQSWQVRASPPAVICGPDVVAALAAQEEQEVPDGLPVLHAEVVDAGKGQAEEDTEGSDDSSEEVHLPGCPYDDLQYEALLAGCSQPVAMELPGALGWLGAMVGSNLLMPGLWEQKRPVVVPMPRPVPVVPPVVQPTKASFAYKRMQPALGPVGSKKARSMAKEVCERRQLALNAWLIIASVNFEASTLGEQIRHVGADEAMAIVSDTLECKATSTLRSRAYSLSQFLRWHAASEHALGSAFPIDEAHAYGYVCHLRETGAPATRASRFRESLAFAQHCVGFSMPDSVLGSKHMAGAALCSFRTKRVLLQRDPITLIQLPLMEKEVVSGADLALRVFLGTMLFALHTRSRYSDVMNVNVEPTIDEEYVEAAITQHKMAHASGRGHRWLPLAGFACGVTGLPWAKCWLQCRVDSSLAAAVDEPFMPMPLRHGRWSQAKLPISHATVWLREFFLSKGLNRDEVSNLGTHSLKACLLSWLAKAGAAGSDRKMLGNHISKADASMVTYSRDALAGPLRCLGSLLEAVRSGRFHPDRSRSGRWTLPGPDDQLEASSSSGSSTESDEQESSSGEEGFGVTTVAVSKDLQTAQNVAVIKKIADDGGEVWRHIKRLTFHIKDKPAAFKCGRLSSEAYVPSDENRVLWPRCVGCFVSEAARSNFAFCLSDPA